MAGAREGRAVFSVILHNAKGDRVDVPIDGLSDLVHAKQAVTWIDVTDASPAQVTRIGEEFGFHPLAIEDTIAGELRPKIEQYDGYHFIIFYGLTAAADGCHSHIVDIFVGNCYMITFHGSGLPVIAETAERWRVNAAAMQDKGPGFLLYSLLDALVDGYFPVLDAIADQAEDLEEEVLRGGQPLVQAEILRLRRDLLMIRRVTGPERDILNVLVRRDAPLFGEKEVVYFQDIYDHLLRVTDTVDIYRDMLSSVLDANLSMVSYTLNVVVKRLTASSIILMSITLVAGIYGMNFVYMPELDWRFGYPFAIGLMAVIAAIEIAIFRRIDWL
ncbi:MAG: magnesium/cobalt transporter CorA [Thermomicrobiales bacterium]|nr:magnesium/cobalt transporter CorA [Thermomicrobiales bacterium]